LKHLPQAAEKTAAFSASSELLQQMTGLALVQIIQGLGQGHFHQGGFVVDGYSGQFQFVKFAVKSIEEVF
jgi:hypothetical protein